ncbi:hypothetical protein ACGFYE_41905, partial [Streptomyces zaomyceticus]
MSGSDPPPPPVSTQTSRASRGVFLFSGSHPLSRSGLTRPRRPRQGALTMHDSFHVFDTTLRDGAQREGINLTVADKLTIARHLD